MSSTEGLQIAQVIADLQSLQNADHAAARSLLAPLKSTSPSSDCTNTAPNSSSRRTSSNPKFDKLGRRIVTVSRSLSNTAGTKPPAFTRAGSSFSINSGISTPMRGMSYSNETIAEGGDEGGDEDLTRARTLLQLFEMRGKFRQMGDTGLSRAKERVDEVVARYAKEDLEEREKVARSRYLGV
ncbi:hypothetical protein WAI453_007040 [Rhynchosporium graminicola]|uniref:Uncharacterized protein n=1 Tax=Rhynchosporium graminicola TaxID=2792576 RepID=A0A1E1LH28_9HELO|nr:uncharacterized protein RCO7_02180 [Rhynchosporium commune]